MFSYYFLSGFWYPTLKRENKVISIPFKFLNLAAQWEIFGPSESTSGPFQMLMLWGYKLASSKLYTKVSDKMGKWHI